MSAALDVMEDNLRFLREHDEFAITEERAPAFDAGILPEPLRAYIEAHARAIGVPTEMVAMPALAFVGSLMGNRLGIRLKAGWNQYPALWVGIVAPPGAAKTPSLNAARWPLDKLQAEAHTRYLAELTEWEADLESWQANPREGRGEKPIRPRMRHFYSTDLTIEALVSILETAPGVANQRDELVGWVHSMDQYRGGKGSDRQQYLSLWSSTPIKQDRRGGETIFQTRPVVSIVGGIQPELLQDLQDKNGRRDGFVERVLLIRPEIERRGWTEEEADPSLLDGVVEVYRSLDERLASLNQSGDDTDRLVQLHPDARALWVSWFNENDERIALSKGVRAGFLSKLPLQVARFALILNTLWNLDDPQRLVSRERMEHAIWLGEFCLEHFERTIHLMGAVAATASSPVQPRILRIIRTDETADQDGWIARSRILVRLGNIRSEQLTDELAEMKRLGFIESRLVPTTTRPREEWRPTLRSSRKIRSFEESPEFPATARKSARNGFEESPFEDSSAFEGFAAQSQDPSNPSNLSNSAYEELL